MIAVPTQSECIATRRLCARTMQARKNIFSHRGGRASRQASLSNGGGAMPQSEGGAGPQDCAADAASGCRPSHLPAGRGDQVLQEPAAGRQRRALVVEGHRGAARQARRVLRRRDGAPQGVPHLGKTPPETKRKHAKGCGKITKQPCTRTPKPYTRNSRQI